MRGNSGTFFLFPRFSSGVFSSFFACPAPNCLFFEIFSWFSNYSLDFANFLYLHQNFHTIVPDEFAIGVGIQYYSFSDIFVVYALDILPGFIDFKQTWEHSFKCFVVQKWFGLLFSKMHVCNSTQLI